MSEKLFLLAFIVCGLSFFAERPVTSSCVSCPTIMQGPPCQEFWRADAVFIGLVTEAIAVDWSGSNINPYSQYRQLKARLSVEQSFRGTESSAEVIFEMNDCPYPFKQGERYLVYAHKDREGKLYQRIGFSRTRPLSEAKEDLEFIRGLSTAKPGTKVYGKVTRSTHNIKESRYDYEPLTGVKVFLASNDQDYEAVTDSEGQYQFLGLAAGTYRIRAELPAHLSFKEETIKVRGQSCVPLDISAMRDGQIAGRVLDINGQPMIYVPVSLVSADAELKDILLNIKDRWAWTFSVTNSEGRFGFSRLAPGNYMLIINRAEFERTRGTERAQALPMLFYPGVTSIDQAVVITLREGQKAREYDFHLPDGY
jgi:hypothetical protein